MRVRLRSRQTGRRVDLILGALVVLGVVTGVLNWSVDSDWPIDPIQVHAASALAILLLTPWKLVVVRRGLRRATAPGRSRPCRSPWPCWSC